MKFPSIDDQEEIRRASTPKEAAEKGRDRKRKLRPNWDSVRDDYMSDAILAKFTQHEALRSLLISTGDAILVEHTEKDIYWGDGGDGRGQNKLGKILMEIRKKLDSETK
jgi:N-glycosidase YbiA